MKLTPARPPGRSSRKALEYEEEIQRLRSLGYSFDAIRSTLADAGVHVSKSTVRREAARPLPMAQAAIPDRTALPAATASPRLLASDVDAPTPPEKPVPPSSTTRTSKDLAADFCSTHITNPLLRRTEP